MTDGHTDTVFISCVSGGRMHGMTGRINRYIGGHLTIISDHHGSHVDDGAVVVRKKILSDVNVTAVIAEERRVHESSV